MTVYYVDDGGSNTNPYDTWAKAAPTLAALQTAIPGSTGTGGNVIYIGADSVSSGDGAAVTFTGPTSGICTVISATVGTTTYAKSATNQVSTTGTQSWIGNFALYGLQVNASDAISFNCPTGASGAETYFYTNGCTAKPGSNRSLNLAGSGTTTGGVHRNVDLTVSAANDSGVQSATFINLAYNRFEFNGITFVDSGSHRTGTAIASNSTNHLNEAQISGADFSTLTGLSAIIGMGSGNGLIQVHNCKTAASPTWATGTANAPARLIVTNSGSTDAPEKFYFFSLNGSVESQSAIYRDSGASVETVPVSWKMVSSSTTAPSHPLTTPWMYGVISATGSKTFDVYVTQDGGSGDLTDADVWLELEYLGTSNVAQSTLVTDMASVSGFFSGAAAQTDDATSTWTGSITETYMQKLSVTATVNEDGLYRARVALGKASTTLYVDPIVTVS